LLPVTCLTASRLHYPVARSKVLSSNLATFFCGTMPFAQALIHRQAGGPIAGRGLGNLKSKWLERISATVLVAVLCGCGGSRVTLKNPSIPKPLIAQLPMSVAARYPAEFDNFVHEEQVIGKEKWTIDLGSSNRLLFTQLFGAMFTEFMVIEEGTDARDLPIDALIEPSIDAFEFSVPNQSQTDEFAVWIRYRIKIFDSDGVQVANWPIAAYGKSQSSTFGGDAALRKAAILAMRDAAALIIMQMDKSTGISKLRSTNTRSNLAPSTAMPDSESIQTTAAEEIPDGPGQ